MHTPLLLCLMAKVGARPINLDNRGLMIRVLSMTLAFESNSQVSIPTHPEVKLKDVLHRAREPPPERAASGRWLGEVVVRLLTLRTRLRVRDSEHGVILTRQARPLHVAGYVNVARHAGG